MPSDSLLSNKITNKKLKLARRTYQFIFKKQYLPGIVSQFRLCRNTHH